MALTFKYATSIQDLDVVMKFLFGVEDVLIPNEECTQVLAFIEEFINSLIYMNNQKQFKDKAECMIINESHDIEGFNMCIKSSKPRLEEIPYIYIF